MNSPLYEIAANVLEMPGILCEYGYWQMRVWGFTERDILHGTFAAASFGAFALCSAIYPESRTPPGFAAAALLPVRSNLVDRFMDWAGCVSLRVHAKWWFKVLRCGVLIVWIAAGATLFFTMPSGRSQDGFTTREVLKDHEQQLREIRAAAGSMAVAQAEMKREIKELKEQQAMFFGWLRDVCKWLIGGGIVAGAKLLIWDTLAAGFKERIAALARRKEDEPPKG